MITCLIAFAWARRRIGYAATNILDTRWLGASPSGWRENLRQIHCTIAANPDALACHAHWPSSLCNRQERSSQDRSCSAVINRFRVRYDCWAAVGGPCSCCGRHSQPVLQRAVYGGSRNAESQFQAWGYSRLVPWSSPSESSVSLLDRSIDADELSLGRTLTSCSRRPRPGAGCQAACAKVKSGAPGRQRWTTMLK